MPAPVAPPPPNATASPERSEELVIVAAGDVNLGRGVGQRILRDPNFDPFEHVRPLLSRAHLAFANLESPLSDQNGETESPTRPLTFVGPPEGAALVARAPFHVVSVANNHVWDYGEQGFLDTLAALEKAGVRYAGATRDTGNQYRPAVLAVRGWSIALFAVTDVWNPGTFQGHAAASRVAWADAERLAAEIRRVRAEHDVVLVSYHGGREYSDVPAQEPLDLAKAVMAAGADAVLGHHPHVPQGIGWFSARPALYSLGNFVFGKYRDLEWTARGFVGRLRFVKGSPVDVAACPYVIEGAIPRLGAGAPATNWEPAFRAYLRRSSSFASVGGSELGTTDELGCVPVRPGPAARRPATDSG
jgi:poly-gamma-glutamate synthesis protein (capsule biosynthesis protein)